MSNALAIFFLTISLNYHSLSKKECLEGNWFKAGKKDAYFGFKKNRLNHHKDTCLKYKVKPDLFNMEKVAEIEEVKTN